MLTTNHVLVFPMTYNEDYVQSFKGNTYNLNQLELLFDSDVLAVSLSDFLIGIDNRTIDIKNSFIVDINYIGDTKHSYNGREPRFQFQNLDEETNIPDLQEWVDNRKMVAITDGEAGGIIGYVNAAHEDIMYAILNNC